MIKVTNLNKYYRKGLFGRLHVINNTTIEIPSSGIIAVTGKSGVGKSTLLNAISGLDGFKNGTIDYNGQIVNKYRPKVSDRIRMEQFGFIFQNYYLLKDQTVFQNVVQSLDNFDISEDDKKNRVNYVLKQLDIVKYTNKLVKNLSGGEQQRVSIARALVKSPKVIFADEPTGSLDEKTTFNVLNILKKISKNCTVFIVTHEKELISYYADYIIELDAGTVINQFVPKSGEQEYLAVDQNIYLNEFREIKNLSNDKLNINLYADNNEFDAINIDIAIKNGHIYLQSDQEIHYINDQTEVRLIKDDRYQIKDYVEEDFDYSLSNINYDSHKLRYLDAFKKGIANLRKSSPYRIILKIILVIMCALSIFLADSIVGLENKDLALALTSSKGMLDLDVQTTDSSMGYNAILDVKKEIIEAIYNQDDSANQLFTGSEPLYYQYEGFFQYSKKTFSFANYEFRTLAFLSEDDLVFGRMPKTRNEIVIDEYVLERFMNNNLLNNVFSSYEYFIGKTVKGLYSATEYKVCGVSRTKSPAVYGHEILHYAWMNGIAKKITTLNLLKAEYPELAELTLGEGEAFANAMGRSRSLGFTIVGDTDDPNSRLYSYNFPYVLIIRDEDLLQLKLYACETIQSRLSIETDGSEEMVNKYTTLMKSIENNHLIDAVDGEQISSITITVNNNYQQQYDDNTVAEKNIIKVMSIVTIVFGALSIVFVIVTSNKSMVNQISEIAIYRSLGYPKRYTRTIYFTETIVNVFTYIAISGLFTYAILKIISVIPIFYYSMSIKLWQVLVLILALGIANSIIGVAPIVLLLFKTPTQIYNTYNRRIES